LSDSTTTRHKLLVVSNRAPVSYQRDPSGARVARRGGGGVVTALGGLLAHHDVTWVASAMSEEDRAVAAEHEGSFEEETRDGAGYRLRLVAHDPAAYDRYYNVLANPTLWFLQHYLWGLGSAPDFDPRLHDAWDAGYVPVNEAFATATLEELEREPDAAVMFHDYHLYVAPRLVREARPELVTSHFVHIPWPEPDYWHALPEELRVAVHEGLLANDVVGFHTERWRRAFLLSAQRLLGARGRSRRDGRAPRPPDASSPIRSASTQASSIGWARTPPCSSARASSPSGVPSSSCCGSTGSTRRRTSSAASTSSRFCSTAIRSCTRRWGWLPCSPRLGRTFPSTRNTRPQSSGRPGR
jgi:trehalose-6-phosphate synthase